MIDDIEASGAFATPDDPWAGRTVGNYRLIERLGEGGMGVVYLAEDLSLNRPAAVKFLYTQMASDHEYLGRFIREARAAATLNHPNLVVIYDAGVAEEDVYYYSMEYIAGGNLAGLIQRSGPLSEQEAVGFIREAASGLAYAHNKGIIHRDVKPDNLMLDQKKLIKVGDLGLAKWAGDGTHVDTTPSGQVIGTPLFMSPEQVRGVRHVDTRSDIYSLGATLYYLVTGTPPYLGPTAAVIMSMHLRNPVPDPKMVNPALSLDFCKILKKMMAKKVEERYQTMAAVDAALVLHVHRPPEPS